MTIRSIIVLLTLPLFLGLALVNGALLYFQDRTERGQALNDHALAATVTVAEFVREMDDPRQEFAQPVRRQALQAALRHVTGIDGLYLVMPGEPPIPLKASASGWQQPVRTMPPAPSVSTSASEKTGDRWITAVAPAGHGRFVASRFSAEPLRDHMAAVRRDVLLIVMALGLLATGLGLFVAHRITRELATIRQQLGGMGESMRARSPRSLLIREARDLADALRLMEASSQVAESRRQRLSARNRSQHDPRRVIVEVQASVFAPCTIRYGHHEIAMRLCGQAEPGTFFAHAPTETGGSVVIGRCRAGSPIASLAAAADVRRLIERCADTRELDGMIGRLRALHEFDALERCDWTHHEPAIPALIAGGQEPVLERVRTYCLCTPGIPPGILLASLDVMLAPNGVFAAIGPAGSGQCGDRRFDIMGNDKDRAEATDIEHFTH